MLNSLLRVATVFVAACAIHTGAAAQNSLINGSPNGAVSSVVQTDQVRAELLAHAPQGIDPGKTVWVGLQLTHQPHWHTYWKNPGDSGLPTMLNWKLPAGVQAGDIAWPAPEKIAIGALANFGYEGTVLLAVPLTIGPEFRASAMSGGLGDLEIRLNASWLVCRQECIPQDGDFVLRIPARGSMALHGAAFDAALASAPKAHTGAASAQIENGRLHLRVAGLPATWQGKALAALPEISEVAESNLVPSSKDKVSSGSAVQAATQAWAGDVWTAVMPLSPQRNASPAVLPVVLIAGQESLRTEMPVSGTWPAVAGTAGSAEASAAPASTPNNLGAWLFALGAALLGGLILNLMPCVFPVLAIKVLGFAGHAGHTTRSQRMQGLAYTAGVVLSFMALGGLMLALRAGGEQLGWGFQLQSPGVITALAILFTLLGLNLAGLLEVGNILPSGLASMQFRHPVGDAFLSGVLAVAIASPCTAPFMGASLGYAIALPAGQALGIFAALGLGLALPFLVASWVPQISQWMPRPGPWMVQLRGFMAFPMWATVVWLLWVLGHLSGVDGAASLLALLLVLALLAWSLSLVGRARWIFASISIAALALLAGATGQNIFKLEETAGPPAAGAAATWQPWSAERVQTELAQGKPVFVDFTAAWCITCQYNKKTTLANADVMGDFNAKKVTLLRADWTRRDPTITQALTALGRTGVPVYVLYQAGKPPVVLSELISVDEVRTALQGL